MNSRADPYAGIAERCKKTPRSVSRERGASALWDYRHRVQHTLNSLYAKFHQDLEVQGFATTDRIRLFSFRRSIRTCTCAS